MSKVTIPHKSGQATVGGAPMTATQAHIEEPTVSNFTTNHNVNIEADKHITTSH